MPLDPIRRCAMYTDFLGQLEQHNHPLLPQHTEQLYHKRGLTGETAQQARLVSGQRQRVRGAIDVLREMYSSEELHEAGLMSLGVASSTWHEDKHHPDPKIIIPYLDVTGQRVLYLRAHKRGPRDVPLEVYGTHLLRGLDTSEIVLTEGEYKTMALHQCKIPSLAVPGVSSFSGKHLSRLQGLLDQLGCRRVVVLFDNEIKDDPRLSGYKEDPTQRWDTEHYAIDMAKKLWSRNRRDTAIARLPDAWRIDGKIDPDGALAAGHYPGDLMEVVQAALPWYDYQKELCEEARIVVSYKQRRNDLRRSSLMERHRCYRWVVERDDQGHVLRSYSISNFVIAPERRIVGQEGEMVRRVQVCNENAESVEAELPAAVLSGSVSAFRAFLLGLGNYHWRGDERQMQELAQRLDALNTPRIATEAPHWGKQEDGAAWVFDDGVLYENHPRQSPMGEDGIAWGQGLRGIARPVREYRPAFLGPPKPVSTFEVYRLMHANIGNPGVALAIGWSLACVFSQELFEELHMAPILAVFGRKESGKTTFCRFLTEAWGLPKHSKNPIRLVGSSVPGLSEVCADMSSMPVWIDELRKDLPSKIVGLLRSLFDRQGRVIKAGGEPVRACLLLSGEDVPRDPALMSRLVILRLSSDDRDNTKRDSLEQGAHRLRQLIRHAIQTKQEHLSSVGRWIQFVKLRLDKVGSPGERTSYAYAIALGTFLHFAFGDHPLVQDPGQTAHDVEHPAWAALAQHPDVSHFFEIADWLGQEMRKRCTDSEEIDHVLRFFERILVLTTRFGSGRQSIVNRQHLLLSRKGDSLRFWYTGLYPLVATYERQVTNEEAFSKEAIRDYFSDYPYIDSKSQSRTLPSGADGKRVSRPTFAIDLTHPELPGVFKELAETLSVPNWDLQPNQAFYDEGSDGLAPSSPVESSTYPEAEQMTL